MRRVAGDTDAAVVAREEEETSASCSRRRSWSWVSTKWGIEIGVEEAIVLAGGSRENSYMTGGSFGIGDSLCTLKNLRRQ